jgi:altronate hydrolase
MARTMKKAIRVEKEDNVAVVAQDTLKGDRLDCSGFEIVAGADIPLGHKIALGQIEEGFPVFKFGVPIGRAKLPISAGDHVHVHNLADITEELCNNYEKIFKSAGA